MIAQTAAARQWPAPAQTGTRRRAKFSQRSFRHTIYNLHKYVTRKLLPAIASFGPVAKPTSAAFLKKCALSASSVRSAITNLCDHDIIYKSESGYIVYERLFGEWLKRYASADSAAIS